MTDATTEILWFQEVDAGDTARVGGKNASLGEMVQHLKAEGIAVPDGFATTAACFRRYLTENDLDDLIKEELGRLDHGEARLQDVGRRIRRAIVQGSFPEDTEETLTDAYDELSRRYDRDHIDVAVRSSATAEDLPDASFAGQQETYLNIHGHRSLLDACRRCFASLFTDRAISYREQKGFDHLAVALSVGVQKMVRSDRAGAGVAFTLDTETGFPEVVLINAAFGLGEVVVQGTVDPDEYTVFKPLLDDTSRSPILEKRRGQKAQKMIYAGGTRATEIVTTPPEERRRFVLEDEEILTLGRWCRAIERHYERPMDIEWAKDGDSGDLFIVQARPETVQSRRGDATLSTYELTDPGEPLLRATGIGDAAATGPVCLMDDPSDSDEFPEGAILVTRITHPDWVPIMKKAAGIITELGGRTSHAAIVSRELGVPALVGATDATDLLNDGQIITLSCAGDDRGAIYDGEVEITVRETDLSDLPSTHTEIMVNLASPDAAFRWWRLPLAGVGLARMEFIIENHIKIHPMALIDLDAVDDDARQKIRRLTEDYEDRRDYFVERLASGIGRIAAAHYPRPVIVRTSDFKTNEYADLIGGKAFEPHEANPMLGFRGASRYDHDLYRAGFALECKALRRVRHHMGLTNLTVMIPFCRTTDEADRVLDLMARHGLTRGEEDLEVYMMCEIPSNVVLIEEFARRFDGFSIGSNDLTQLILGVDRDSALLADTFDERDPAVMRTIETIIEGAHRHDRKVGICGQAPSDHPDFAAFLVEAGIDSISVSPDSFAAVLQVVADEEDRHRDADQG